MVVGVKLAECRLYDGLRASWNGFIKNAHEGMATPVGLPIWTTLLAGAHIWPFFLLPEWQAALAILLVFLAHARLGHFDLARQFYAAATKSADHYDLELADGRWMDSRRAARLAMRSRSGQS